MAGRDEDMLIKVRPKMRAVEAVHYKQQGQDMFMLRDPTSYSESQLHVSPDVFLIASMFDGEHDVASIQKEFQQRFGARVTETDIQKVVGALENAHFLDGPAFEEWRDKLEAEYRKKKVRESTLAGSCYPEDARDIPTFLNGFFIRKGGPGRPVERRPDARPLRALIVPHIDLRRGGVGFAHAYRALWEAKPPATVVILGVGHAGKGEMLSFTRKHFRTPLGTLETDAALVESLAEPVGAGAFADEYVHKGEHSIEIQAIWLQHVGGANAPKIVPVLCGPLKECIEKGTSPRQISPLAAFIDALGRTLRESAGRVLLIASADLAHIGHKFGDQVPLTPRLLRKNEEMDRKMLSTVHAGDAEAFFEFIRKEEDRRKICGLAPIYVLLAACEAAAGRKAAGRTLYYEQSSEEETQSLVSFAAVAFD